MQKSLKEFEAKNEQRGDSTIFRGVLRSLVAAAFKPRVLRPFAFLKFIRTWILQIDVVDLGLVEGFSIKSQGWNNGAEKCFQGVQYVFS